MKPFTTDKSQGGKFVLPFQVEGLPASQLRVPFKKARILAFGLPESHTFEAAWLFRLVLDTEWTVDFSSACTGIGGWQEIGSLKLEFAPQQSNRDSIHWLMKPLANFRLELVERLVYEDADVYTECGIALKDSTHREIVVAAGTAPGSVSIAAPFSTDRFQPELPIEKLQRRPI
jgi:hypothetical protein